MPNTYDPQYYAEHKEQFHLQQQRYYYNNLEKSRERSREKDRKNKLEALKYYSITIVPCCSRCGIIDTDVLTIDHINGGGNKHRRELGICSSHFNRWLKKNDYPDGYQVLCFNCNVKKHLESLRDR